MRKSPVYAILLIATLNACSSSRKAATADNGKIDINFVQVNDVYEIAPLSNGTEGGMARVATIKKKYLQQNPNTFLVMAGDFLSPSVYNSLKFEGKAIRGRQMVEAMNAAGTDLAVFGNHEFDIKESEVQERINESNFLWVSSNTFQNRNDKAQPFVKMKTGLAPAPFPETYIRTITDADGTTVKIGFIGLTLPFNKATYVSYTDALETAKKLYARIKDSCDAVIAITHQSMQEDMMLAAEIPGLAAILGGHEHDQEFQKVGNIFITKAMANAKSAYIIRMRINKNTHVIKIKPKLEVLNEKVPLDSATNSVVQKWTDIANRSYSSLGFDAKQVLPGITEPLDGREIAVRTTPTTLTRLIVNAMIKADPAADIVIVNAGSIRVDDILQPPVTQYDIIRSLPFGGGIKPINIKGSVLSRILDVGQKNKGIGGYLHYNENVHADAQSGKWMIGDKLIDPEKIYRACVSEFMLTGGEANLDFVNPKNPDITILPDTGDAQAKIRSDIRGVIFEYLKNPGK